MRLTALLLSLICFTASAKSTRFIFLGDVLLGREVETEMKLKPGISPWSNLAFPEDANVVANFESSIGPFAECLKKNDLCLTVHEARLSFLKTSGIDFAGLENNHTLDLGEAGRKRTESVLKSGGLETLTYETSPYFIQRNAVTLAIVALTFVNHSIPSTEIRKKLRLAKQLSDWVIVYVHWGNEFIPFPNDFQKARAQEFVSWGADLVIGHHPHVVQTSSCVSRKPVFYSLGNHLFDQRYPSTHTGLAIDCQFSRNELNCSRRESARTAKSSFPTWTTKEFPKLGCEKLEKKSSEVHWKAISGTKGRSLHLLKRGFELIRTDEFQLEHFSPIKTTPGSESFFIGHLAYSTFDDKISLRPSVYSRTGNRLVAMWKGSILAYPVEDMEVLERRGENYLCAYHSETGHFLKKPTLKTDRIMAYVWNGFGFSSDKNDEHQKDCSSWAMEFGYKF